MQRLDVYLYENKHFTSRSLAKDAIKENRIKINDKIISKASYLVSENDIITVIEKEHSFASRGGNKLFGALQQWDIDLHQRVVLDIGASTGGFSDVCLQQGAAFVYAVDIGHDQLIERLKNDDRVANMEGVNCRYLSKDMFDKRIDFVCMDVSFISIKLIVDSLLSILEPPFECVFLIKPQFEAGKQWIGKNGIVKDKKVHKRILEDMLHYFHQKGVGVYHLMKSDTVGRSGNQEYLIHIKSETTTKSFSMDTIIKG